MARRSWVLLDREPGAAAALPLELGPEHVGGTARGYRVRAYEHAVGRSRGVLSVVLDNGAWQVEVLPTRGMGLWKARCGPMVLGWESPVRGPVHPAYVPLSEPSGLGWLDGFDELLVRCGLESNGAPEFDEHHRLRYPLHGRIANAPAHRLELQIDDQTGELALTGEVDEVRFHFLKVRLTSTLRMRLGETTIALEDRVTNLSASPAEIQLLYHVNFGRPLLDAGSRARIPARTVVPRDRRAAEGLGQWDRFGADQAGFAEQVYFCQLHGGADGRSEVLLHNALATQGVSLDVDLGGLPYFTLWKNTTSVEDGYVAGLEPGTNFPNPRSWEGERGRVVRLAGRSSCRFDLRLAYHPDAPAVQRAVERVEGLAAEAPQVIETPERE